MTLDAKPPPMTCSGRLLEIHIGVVAARRLTQGFSENSIPLVIVSLVTSFLESKRSVSMSYISCPDFCTNIANSEENMEIEASSDSDRRLRSCSFVKVVGARLTQGISLRRSSA